MSKRLKYVCDVNPNKCRFFSRFFAEHADHDYKVGDKFVPNNYAAYK